MSAVLSFMFCIIDKNNVIDIKETSGKLTSKGDKLKRIQDLLEKKFQIKGGFDDNFGEKS